MTDTKTNPAAETAPSFRRTRAAEFIDEVRTLAAKHGNDHRRLGAELEVLLEQDFGLEPLTPCEGEAHMVGEGRANGHIDNCSLCAPRWGWVGAKVAVR